jgi:hypothetical protein
VPLRVGYTTFRHEEQELRAKQSLRGDLGHLVPCIRRVSTRDARRTWVFFNLGAMKEKAQHTYLDFDFVI